jgi:hypothetical protein
LRGPAADQKRIVGCDLCDRDCASAGLCIRRAGYHLIGRELRSGASTASIILRKIPTGSLVQVSHCSDWCEVEWLGQKGFVIATALNRRGQASAQHSPGPANAADDNPVPMSLPKVDGGPQRYQGPYIGGAGPGRGFGWLCYRGRW